MDERIVRNYIDALIFGIDEQLNEGVGVLEFSAPLAVDILAMLREVREWEPGRKDGRKDNSNDKV
jgi:hypothetical protein